jgi:hypothetical protein
MLNCTISKCVLFGHMDLFNFVGIVFGVKRRFLLIMSMIFDNMKMFVK